MDSDTSCPTCNRSLLAEDLAIHNLLCAQFSSLPPRPSPNHILGLVFPATASSADAPAAPTPEWIKRTSSTDDETSITFQSVDVSPVFASASSPADPAPEAIYAERNTVRNRDTASMLEIWTLPPAEGASASANANATIAALARGRDGPFHRWTGPVLVLAMTRATGFMVDPGSYRDVGLADAADAVDFLLDYENPEHGRRIREALDTLGAERPKDEAKTDGGNLPDGEDDNQVTDTNQTAEPNAVFEVM